MGCFRPRRGGQFQSVESPQSALKINEAAVECYRDDTIVKGFALQFAAAHFVLRAIPSSATASPIAGWM